LQGDTASLSAISLSQNGIAILVMEKDVKNAMERAKCIPNRCKR
jgi:hypothetical protein